MKSGGRWHPADRWHAQGRLSVSTVRASSHRKPEGTAPDVVGGVDSVRITHPFHPWAGREVEVLDHRNVGGIERVLLEGVDGRSAWIPASWTDVASPDPFLVASDSRSCFRVEDLLRLVELVSDLVEGDRA